MMRQVPFQPTLRITGDIAVRVINGEKAVMDALAHFVRQYVMSSLLVHNPYDGTKVEDALTATAIEVDQQTQEEDHTWLTS
jgi:hypothetical protein